MALDQRLLDEITQDNSATGQQWSAGPTSMLHLTAAERRRRLGYTPGPAEQTLEERERISSQKFRRQVSPAVSFPATWDWRNVENRNFISGIKDQGSCGSCVAFGTAATIDGTMRIAAGIAVNDPIGGLLMDLSEAQLFYCGGAGGAASCSAGWNPTGALAYAAGTGLAPEFSFPYTPGDQSCPLTSGAAWSDLVTTVRASQTLDSTDAMKEWLSTNGPLIACFSAYDDFYAYSSGVYTYNGKAQFAGGHCVCVVGYDEAKQAWICKNQWGTGWGMQGFAYIGYGQCGIDSMMWGISSFGAFYEGPGLVTTWANPYMNETVDAISWLIGDVNFDGKDEIVQCWSNAGTLGMNIYAWSGSELILLWSSTNMQQGSGAVSWNIGDVNGDGKQEIIQCWSNQGTLAMIVYQWTGAGMAVLWASNNMGEGSGAIVWKCGDVNGDDRVEIVQLWPDGASLGMIVYYWNGREMAVLWGSSNVGEGTGAVSWQMADVNGDGREEIVQCWSNDGALGMIVYGWTGSAMSVLWGSANMGQGSGAVSWLAGDVNTDRRDEIVQCWNNGGKLAMSVYGWDGAEMTLLMANANISDRPDAVTWQIGDINADSKLKIIQGYSNGGALGLIVYGWDANANALSTLWRNDNVGQGAGAANWQLGDVLGIGRAQVIQEWSNGGVLGTIVYSRP